MTGWTITHNDAHLAGEPAFRVQVDGIEPRVFDDRVEALEQFRQACGRGVRCSVWQVPANGSRGLVTVLQIAEFPGLTEKDRVQHAILMLTRRIRALNKRLKSRKRDDIAQRGAVSAELEAACAQRDALESAP